MAELIERPFPPGDYPVIVVGSGPGGLQVGYCLARFGVKHAILSADDAPGGMFRRWPFFQRLLSWTKPYAPVDRRERAYERYDWNSLLADEPGNQALMPDLMDGTSYFPSRPEMQTNLETFAGQADITVRYGCRWTGTQRVERDGAASFILETTDGEYRTPTVIFAVGAAEPYVPSFPGDGLAAHYAATRSAASYANKRIFIIGKQNSGFELASGLLQWARRIVIASPSPVKLSVDTRSLVGVRARYVQPYEDHVLGGGVAVLDAAIQRIDRVDRGLEVRVRPSGGGEEFGIEVDEVMAATGFVAPLGDLPDLGVATYGQSRLPAQTPYWESATVPGIYFAGTIGQGAPGLKKHGQPSNSGAVHGARYNARLLARQIARTRFGTPQATERPSVPPAELVDRLAIELASAPELWHQRAYLARVFSLDPSDGPRDEGVVPLASFLDGADGGPTDAIALTIEADGTGAIYPVVYARRGGDIDEQSFEADPLLRYDTPAVRRWLTEIVRPFGLAGIGGR